MKKKITVLFTVIAVLALVFALTACNGEKENEKEALPAETVHISTLSDLTGLNNYLGKLYKNYTFVLDNDIDASGVENWTPIGDSVENAFCAAFDGNGHSVKNLQFKGWNDDYTPIPELLGGKEGMENITSFPTMALFGYGDNATFKNVKIENIDFKFYADSGFSYVAGLVAYNVGASRFENVAVDGGIYIDNVYKKVNTYDNLGNRQGVRSSCEATIYAGGINAYSDGATEFENLSSSIYFNNDFPRSFYHDRSNAEPEELEEEDFEEKYVVANGANDANAAPNQVFVGGVCGMVKGGTVTDCNFNGNLNVYGKSVCAGGILAAGYRGGKINNSVSTGNISTEVHSKSVIGGIVGHCDDFDVQQVTASGIKLSSLHYASGLSMDVGGIFGFAGNTSEISETAVENAKMTINFATANVGGIGGVIRDAKISSSKVEVIELNVVVGGLAKESCGEIFGTVVNSIYNNAELSDDNTVTSATVKLGKETWEVSNLYSKFNTTSYVDENGKLGIRLFEKGKTDKFIYVFAVKEEGGLKVSVHNEELSLLSEAVFSGEFTETDNMAETYIETYFVAGEGFKTATSGELTAEGRDLVNYEYRSGNPVLPN